MFLPVTEGIADSCWLSVTLVRLKRECGQLVSEQLSDYKHLQTLSNTTWFKLC